MKIRVALMLALLSPSAFAATASPKVIGGTTASYPWAALVSVTYPSGKGAYCSGMLLTPNWVVTAAHCMFDRDNPSQQATSSSVEVKIGSSPINPSNPFQYPDPSIHGVSDRYVPKTYTNFNSYTTGDDIALLHLSSSASSSAYPSISDATSFNTLATSSYWERDEAVTVFGWGETSNNSGSLSSTLQEAAIDYVPFTTCNSDWSGQLSQSSMICAAELNPINGVKQDTCSGDSGGPLFIGGSQTPYVIGVTSFGQATCASNLPSVYTKLLNQVSFIETTTSNAGDPLVDLAAEPASDRYYAAPGGSMTVPVKVANESQQNTVTGTRFSASSGATNLTTSINSSSSGVSCTGNSCTLPNLPAQQHVSVDISASQLSSASDQEDNLALSASGNQDDYRLKNNTPTVKLIFSNKPDLTVSAALVTSSHPSPSQGIAQIAVKVSDLSTVPAADAADAQVTASLPANTTISAASNGISCGNNTCDLGLVKYGTPVSFTLTLVSSQPATGDLGLSVSNNDSVGEFPTDNNATTVHFGYPAYVAPSSGGGGGALGLSSLALLLVAGLRRRN